MTKRTIFHVDVNSAFLSWSALKHLAENPGSVDLRTIPSAVGGDVRTRHGIITAKSIPAKKYGIRTGEPVVKALQKCPNLVLVPPDFETYRKYSHALMRILSEFSQVLQQVSIDEAFLDMTESIPPEDRARALIAAQEIRDRVRTELGFTVNVGISSNKLLAKMASDFQKPDRTHTLYPEEVPQKMWPLPIGELYGCGKQTAQKLNLVGINTIGDAAAADPALIQSLLGQKSGSYILAGANERTLAEDVGRDNFQTNGVPVIKELAQKVAARMQKSGLIGQTVTLQVKSSEFQRYSRQMALPEPTDRAGQIESAALDLAERLLTGPEGLFAEGMSIRLIGVGVSRIAEKQVRRLHQMDIFEWVSSNQEEEETAKRAGEELSRKAEAEKRRSEKQAKLDSMMEKINRRYGDGTLEKGCILKDEE